MESQINSKGMIQGLNLAHAVTPVSQCLLQVLHMTSSYNPVDIFTSTCRADEHRGQSYKIQVQSKDSKVTFRKAEICDRVLPRVLSKHYN